MLLGSFGGGGGGQVDLSIQEFGYRIFSYSCCSFKTFHWSVYNSDYETD